MIVVLRVVSSHMFYFLSFRFPIIPVLSGFGKPPFARVLYPFPFGMARDPPPPPEPTMAQLLALMMEYREAAHAEHNATLATLQHLAQLGNNNNGGNGNDGARSKLKDFQNTNPRVFSKIDEAHDADD